MFFNMKSLAAMRRFILLSLLALPAFAVDEQPPKLEALPEAPDPILPAQSGETLEPDITITRKSTKTIEEYRRGGRLYMIKVIPVIGPAYYFIDNDGDGQMDVRRDDLDHGNSKINMWKIFEW